MPSAHSPANPSTLSVPCRLEGQPCGPRCSAGAQNRIAGRSAVELGLAPLGALAMGDTELDRVSTCN